MLMLAQGPAAIIASLTAGGFGIVIIVYTKDPGFLIVPTELISTSVNSIRRRIPDQPGLVSVDLEPVGRSKITMPEFSTGYECSLPDQIMFNPKCSLRPSEIVDLAANADAYLNSKSYPISRSDLCVRENYKHRMCVLSKCLCE
jgi:hypothetical protein